MKKAELYFGAALVPLDYVMLVLAGLSAYALRFQSSVIKVHPVLYEIPFQSYLEALLLTAVGWVIVFAFTGLYYIRSTRRVVEEVRKVFLACSTSVFAIIILFFFERDLFSSRFIILVAYGFAVVYVIAARLGVLYLERWLFRKGVGVTNMVLVGEGHIAEVLVAECTQKPALGFKVIAQFPEWNADAEQHVFTLRNRGAVDQLLLATTNGSKEQRQTLNDFCEEYHIGFRYAAALFDTQTSRVGIQPIAGIPIVEIKRTMLEGWGSIAKRLFDIVGSLVLITITGPVMLIAALAIWINSGRPIFFTRRDDGKKVYRVGQYGKPFFYFKFRTMVPNSDSLRYDETLQQQNMRKGSPLVKIKNDPRVTRVGRILRRTSIDELSEFLLVLKGDMSLVGPRPHLPEEVAQYKKHHKRVLSIKPGITGLAQISGRSDLDFEEEVRLDTFYIEHWALWLDIVILLKTPLILLRRRQAW